MKCDFYKCWCNEELTTLKQSSIDSFNLWLVSDKPRSGCEFLAMKCAKAAYNLAITVRESDRMNSLIA